MKRAALYCRFSTVDQHPETQMSGLRQFAANKGLTVVPEYTDHGYCGARARRPELDRCPASQVRCAAGLGMREAGAFDQAPAPDH